MGGRRALAGAAVLALGLAGCGGGGGGVLATVGTQRITQEQVDRLVALRREALAILVSRAQVEAAARRLGISVTAGEARLRLTIDALVHPLGAAGVQPWIERARRTVPVVYVGVE